MFSTQSIILSDVHLTYCIHFNKLGCPRLWRATKRAFSLGLRANKGDILRQWPKSNVERKICNNWHNIR